MISFINYIRGLFEKMKESRRKKRASAKDSQGQRIVINSRSDSASVSNHDNAASNTPKINVRGINQRTPIAYGTNTYRADINVQNISLGNGITVNRQRKPGRCPICASRGGISENSDGRPRWRCSECDSTFN
jgi:tRNA(Ile2) C34 agmatinyltransferase TiaS